MSSLDKKTTPLDKGVLVIKQCLKNIENRPGVYRMIDIDGDVLYVGKAKNVKKRVLNYTHAARLSNRLQRMVSMTASMVFLYTHTETEALLLESNLIKKYSPKFNILLKDDKSFSYIRITRHHSFPQITKHRGVKEKKDDYFGPFPSASAVNRTIIALQKAFQIRNCSDTMFASRQRPCLQYQIKRCTAPCVHKIGKEDYQQQVDGLCDFLKGKSLMVKENLTTQMMAASKNLDYEKAASFRDRIQALSSIQAHQNINVEGVKDADIVSIYQDKNLSCVEVFFFRGGSHYGNYSYFPKHVDDSNKEEILSAFISQFYMKHPAPNEICLDVALPDEALLQDALSQYAGHVVKIFVPQKGVKKTLLENARDNAKQALKQKQNEVMSQKKLMHEMADIFDISKEIKRIEVYDNSHIQGAYPIGAMIVANQDGFDKASYRKFNIKDKNVVNDDYGMMTEVLKRRFSGSLSENNKNENNFPDLILIDGGKGQLSVVQKVLADLNLIDKIALVSIAKGEIRNAGNETFYQIGKPGLKLPETHPVLYFTQRLRDEAHRFAIGTHRARREKNIHQSPLDAISGIGAKRKKALLLYFGSAKAVETASLQDLQKVDGISSAFAKKIYGYFH